MATLNDLWVERADITRVAVRPGRPVYVSMAHNTPDEAVKRAAEVQDIVIADLMADDWEVVTAPPEVAAPPEEASAENG